MATNIELDEVLIAEALELGQHKTKKAVVEEALIEYVLHRKQQNILKLFGSIDYEDGFDYKEQRKVE